MYDLRFCFKTYYMSFLPFFSYWNTDALSFDFAYVFHIKYSWRYFVS